MDEIDLLPCPFCGAPAVDVYCPPKGWKVSCPSTDMAAMSNKYKCAVGPETEILPSREDSAAAWNRRDIPKTLDQTTPKTHK